MFSQVAAETHHHKYAKENGQCWCGGGLGHMKAVQTSALGWVESILCSCTSMLAPCKLRGMGPTYPFISPLF